MHTSLRVTGVLSGVESSVVLGLGFRGWAAPEAVHEPALVVPGHPRRGDVLQVGEGADRAGAERGTLAHALGLVQPDRGLAEPVVQGVADGPDRRDQPFEHQRLAVMYCGVLTSGVRMMDRVVERVALAGAVGRGVAQRALDEAGVLGQRALPARDQPGVGVDDERGVAEPAAIGT